MDPDADHLIATRFDTVIYDLDGTLIDSARDMCVAVSSVLADHGLPPISDEESRLLMGEGSKMTMRRAFGKNGRTLDDVAGAATFAVRKPDPGHILQLIDKIGGDRERAVMVGDSIHDVEAAHAGGLPAVLVSWGYTDKPAGELGADAVIDHFAALPE